MAHQPRILFKLTDDIVNAFRSLKQHEVNNKLNNSQIKKFRRLLNNARDELQIYEEMVEDIDDIEQSKNKLGKKNLKQCFELVKVMEGSLEQIEDTNSQLGTKTFPTTMKDWFEDFQIDLEDLKTKFERLDNLVGIQKEVFKVINMVPSISRNIYLDFDDKNTPEAQFKDAIFDDKSHETVTVLANGVGGVGKTCALRGCGLHPDVSKRFPDGILYMSLGSESGKLQLIQNIANFVKYTGGIKMYKHVENEKDLDNCITLAGEWFRDRICLFLIDDVSCQNDIRPSVTQKLGGLARQDESKVAFTTRDSKLSGDRNVDFTNRKGPESEKILLRSAGIKTVPKSDEEVLAFKELVEKSDGFPIALNVIGSRVRYYLQKHMSESHVWSYVRDEFQSSEKFLEEEAIHDGDNRSVLNILLQSLELIECKTGNKASRDLFMTFAVIRKRQKIPLDVLERMWGLTTLETRAHIELFERFNIVEINRNYQYLGRVRAYFSVHDLFLDMSRHLAQKQPGVLRETSTRILYSYVNGPNVSPVTCTYDVETQSEGLTSLGTSLSERGDRRAHGVAQATSETNCSGINVQCSPSFRGQSVITESWIDIADDSFIFENLFRLFDISGMHKDGFMLLCHPHWICRQMKVSKWKQLDDDITILMRHFRNVANRDEVDDAFTFLKMLRAALVESEPYIIQSKYSGMIFTQIYGRLSNYKGYKFVDKFLQHMERIAPPGTWMKSEGVFPAPSPSYRKVLTDIHNVVWLPDNSDCPEFIIFDGHEKLFQHKKYISNEDDLVVFDEWRVEIESRFDNHCECGALSGDRSVFAAGFRSAIAVFYHCSDGADVRYRKQVILNLHGRKPSALSIAKNGEVVVSGLEDGRRGTLMAWRRKQDNWYAEMMEGHNHAVRSVAVTENGRLIASASSRNGDVILHTWNANDNNWKRGVLKGHSESVQCVIFNRDGSQLVSASWDETVRVWRETDGVWLCSVLTGGDDWVRCMVTSKRGGGIVCGGRDRHLRIWWSKDGEWKNSTLDRHTGWVDRVGMTTDSIVSWSGNDATIRITAKNVNVWNRTVAGVHTRMVNHVTVSCNGERLVSGGDDGNVVVWEVVDGVCERTVLEGSAGKVSCVTMRNDGLFVASASGNDTIRIWRLVAGKWLANNLNGHNSWVNTIAICEEKDRVVSGGYMKVGVWNLIDDLWSVEWLNGHTDWVKCVLISHNGQRIVSGGRDETVRVWECNNNRWVMTVLRGHIGPVRCLDINGGRLVSASSDGTIRVWDFKRGAWQVMVLEGPEYLVENLSLIDDGRQIRARDCGSTFVCYIEEDGSWKLQDNGDTSPSDWFGWIEKHEWPHDISMMNGEHPRLWKAADGVHFVRLENAPYFGYLLPRS